jgi:hypothetical protein
LFVGAAARVFSLEIIPEVVRSAGECVEAAAITHDRKDP